MHLFALGGWVSVMLSLRCRGLLSAKWLWLRWRGPKGSRAPWAGGPAAGDREILGGILLKGNRASMALISTLLLAGGIMIEKIPTCLGQTAW